MDFPVMNSCSCEAPCPAAGVSGPYTLLDPVARQQADLLLTQAKVDAYLAMFPWCQRVAAYWEVVDRLRVADRVRLLRDLWDVDAMPSQRPREWRRELWLCSAYPYTFMSADERDLRRGLPNPLTIYRGVTAHEHTPAGFAWSVDRTSADFFAYAACRARETTGHVFVAECSPYDAIAYLINMDGREDLAIFPEQIKSWRKTPMCEIVEILQPSGDVLWTFASPTPDDARAWFESLPE